ncbi:MAG: TRAP transporter substrate-binding protein [Burkholderiales bacterium]|nr:TRAP transporter substrate-binding protein [Burkholderiales bacterium]
MPSPLKALAAGLAAALAFAHAGAQAQDKIRLAGNFETAHSSSVAMEQVFKAELAKLTRNQLQVDIFPAMQLGGAKENVDAVRAGSLLMTWVGAAYLSRIIPELEAVSLPFLFPSREAAFRVMDGNVGKLIDQKMADKNFTVLGWMELGSRNITNNKKPIRSIEDLKGLKIRLQPNETHLATFRALGANAVAMDVKELYSALEQKVLDGQENPFPIIRAARYMEVQKYLSNSGHFFDFIVIVANKKSFEGLKPDYQKAIREAMAATVAAQRASAAKADADALEELKKRMEYTELSPQVREAMRKATAGVIDDVKKRAGAALVDSVLAEVAKSR